MKKNHLSPSRCELAVTSLEERTFIIAQQNLKYIKNLKNSAEDDVKNSFIKLVHNVRQTVEGVLLRLSTPLNTVHFFKSYLKILRKENLGSK